MGGYQEQDHKCVPAYNALEPAKKSDLTKYTGAPDMDVTSRHKFCTEEIDKVTKLEGRMSTELTKYSQMALRIAQDGTKTAIDTQNERGQYHINEWRRCCKASHPKGRP